MKEYTIDADKMNNVSFNQILISIAPDKNSFNKVNKESYVE